MPKIDKTQLSKSQWRLIKEERRTEKQKNTGQQNVNPPVKPETPLPKIQKDYSKIKTSGVAFVLGNGVSRKDIDLNTLTAHGEIYGCNALCREFEPDYLVAVDTKMILEIVKTGYHLKHPVWTNYNRSYSKYSGLNFFQPSKGWSSGPTALNMASERQYQTVYILGFDYIGLGDRVNNVYAGTNNYKKIDERATYHGNWLRQTQIVIKNFPQIRYIRVVDENGFIPKEFSSLENLTHIKVEEFKKIFEKS
jgi:hypothetical protein